MKKEKADQIIYNARVYTVNDGLPLAEAFAVRDGEFLAVGSIEDILNIYKSDNMIDLAGKAVFPGFIDGHCHFYGYGKLMNDVQLTGTRSFDEVVERVVAHQKSFQGAWVLGRGWDQNDWDVKEYPNKDLLDKLFPETPVYLRRVDGHAAIANQTALDLAGVDTSTRVIGGVVDIQNGALTGILIDNAMDLVGAVIPKMSRDDKIKALMNAQEDCFIVGLTTVVDAGLDISTLDLIAELQQPSKNGAQPQLMMRIYAMAEPDTATIDHHLKKGIFKTPRLNIRSFKFYVDGALGSRGARLIEPYTDKPQYSGHLISTPEYLKDMAEKLYANGFQMNAHCIGDSAVRLMLNIYGTILKGKNDLRWRIEHAQVIAPDDFRLFGQYNIIPSVQPTHATSDMYWAEQRLGPVRIKGAYACQQLLDQNGFLVNGSDFPVESINPIFGFYAAVTRKDQDGYPPAGFQKENALTREQALKAMTIWAAYGSFEENEKGSIEPGKFADYVVLDKDIMEIPENEIFSVKVLMTVVDGVVVYEMK